jgi:hypothetical protein
LCVTGRAGERIENVLVADAVDLVIIPVIAGGGDRRIADGDDVLDTPAQHFRRLDADAPAAAIGPMPAGAHFPADLHQMVRIPVCGHPF